MIVRQWQHISVHETRPLLRSFGPVELIVSELVNPERSTTSILPDENRRNS